jgi:hypothetical protein
VLAYAGVAAFYKSLYDERCIAIVTPILPREDGRAAAILQPADAVSCRAPLGVSHGLAVYVGILAG